MAHISVFLPSLLNGQLFLQTSVKMLAWCLKRAQWENNKNPMAKFRHMAAGNVIYGSPAAPNFSVRLTQEIFERCVTVLQRQGRQPPFAIYDPCCGTGYLLTVLGFLKGSMISTLIGSDTNEVALNVAHDNLSLLSHEGLCRREEELKNLFQLHQKRSHLDALTDIELLRQEYQPHTTHVEFSVFQHDILAPELPLLPKNPDIVIADVPYGQLCHWTSNTDTSKESAFVESISRIVGAGSLLCLVRQRHSSLLNPSMVKAGHFCRGHREVRFFLGENPR